jgi:lipopolysaccharide export system permease protein
VRILSRYIFKEVGTFFLISLSAFTGLLLVLRMLRLTSLIINRGVEVGQIARVFVAIIPTFLEIALPMSTLLGVMLAFSRLCGDSEVVVMRASGISILNFLKPIGLFAVVVGTASLFVSVSLRPWGFASLSNALFDVAKSKSISGLTQGVFNKLGDITLYAESIDYESGDLMRVLVDDKRDEAQRKVVIAKRGRIVADENTHTISLLLGDGVAHEQTEGRYSRTEFTSNSLSVDPSELRDETKKGVVARELQVPKLSETIEYYRGLLSVENQESFEVFGETITRKELLKKFRRSRIELGQRFSLPCAAFIMAFVGLALGIMSPRTQRAWGAGFAGLLGLIVFVIYYSVFSVGVALADKGSLPIVVALWAPNVITTALAVWILYKLGTEQWHSVSEGAQNYCTRAVETVRRYLKRA